MRKFAWPKIPFNQYRDTQAIASAFALPLALDKCGEVLKLAIQKDKRGSYLIQKLSKPQKPSKKNPYIRWTKELFPDLYQEMYDYCIQDVEAERAILTKLPWGYVGNELEIWRHTVRKNERGIPIDLELIDAVVNRTEEYLEDVTAMVGIITGNKVQTINQRAKILQWCESQGYELPDLTADTVTKSLEDPEIDNFPGVKTLLEIRKTAGKSSIKKFPKLQQAVCFDGRIRDCLKYHRATTGREGGRLLQPQNLPRAEIKSMDIEKAIEMFKNDSLVDLMGVFPDFLYACSALIRPSITAPPGYKFVVSDYSQVENRGLFWLAGQEDALRKIENGLCLYTDMATSLYDLSYDQIPKDSEMRRHGKLTILGCGYGMGAKKFLEDCLMRGFNLDMAGAKRTIDIFREKYYHVKEFWYGLKDAAEDAIINQGTLTSFGYIQFMSHQGFLFLILPNGKALAYYKPRVEEVKAPWGWTQSVTHLGMTSKNSWRRVSLTPGRLAENATQAMCREILMEAVLDLERLGHKIILTVHDEVVIETPIDGGVSIDEVNKIMCNRDEVYTGFPLKAAGFETKRYKK